MIKPNPNLNLTINPNTKTKSSTQIRNPNFMPNPNLKAKTAIRQMFYETQVVFQTKMSGAVQEKQQQVGICVSELTSKI